MQQTVSSSIVLLFFAGLAFLSSTGEGFTVIPARTCVPATSTSRQWFPVSSRSSPGSSSVAVSTVSDDETEAEAAEAPEAAAAAEEAEQKDDATEVVAEAASAAVEEIAAESSTDSGDEQAEGRSPNKKFVKRERHTMFVGNLPFDASDIQVRDLFSKYGKVELVSVPRNRETGQPRGFAFVDVSSEEELQAAIAALDMSEFEGRQIRVTKSMPKGEVPVKTELRVEPPGTKKIYVGNIKFETTKEDLMEYYSKFGEVIEAYVPSDRNTGLGRGFGFVTMNNEDAETAIQATNGSEFQGRKLVVSVPLPPGEKAPPRRPSGNAPRLKLYIGNLSFYTVPETLSDLFSEFGTVHDCYLPEDPTTGGSRGFGFVTMDKNDGKRAIDELDGCEIDGRIIRVNEAQPKRRPRDNYDDEEESGSGYEESE